MYNKLINDLKNKHICILGFGKEGRSTYKYLTDNGINNIDIRDQKKQEIDGIYGENYLDNLEQYDVIIKTPGISLFNIDTSKFENKLTSELELIMEYSNSHIIGVTGSKGKSTTTSLIYKMLKDQDYDAYLLGNIGTPIFDDIEYYTKDSYLVVEMSALQLEYIHKSPHIGIITNLYEEHLDHFGTSDKYYNAKMNMFKYQNDNDYGIYSGDNIELVNRIKKGDYKSNLYSVGFNREDICVDNNYIYMNNKKIYNVLDDRKLIGNHNLIDIMLSLKVADILNLDIDKCINTINTFIPLEHRMELVGTYNDIVFYNDAIATIPAATINCIDALKTVDTLITGGKDRGIDYTPLIDYINKSNVSNIICMPETGYKIMDKLNKKTYKVDKLEDAVKLAKQVTKKGMICVLSPSASSYNQFKNFEEKGTMYKQYVRGE